ncbi:SpoIIE family protein phosphatase [Paracrocinitomix mangrovi]|uniref:SpoIIE family protein phosphatase n=1 Tax=Paracrocinitomix mangrovi TaxID=2862509 RepID=UPI001EDB0506|nr:SpoIIE family protein phosphatase [Paracrocinitomix mangrovi]UKN01831.1 SpoIIE family protein phosphatase [Paracrocinitomix mangrovi]
MNFKNIDTEVFGTKEFTYQTWLEDGSFLGKTEFGLLHHNGYSGKTFIPSKDGGNTILSQDIVSISNIREDEIWIGYLDTCAVTKINTHSWQFEHFYIDELNLDTVQVGAVVRFKVDKNDQMWLCTWGRGLIKFNEGKGDNKMYIFNSDIENGEQPKEEAAWYIKDLAILEDNQFFVTFFKGGGGSYSYPGFFNPETEEFSRIDIKSFIKDEPKDFQNKIEIAIKIIHWVHRDNNGKYWLGSYSGVLLLDLENEKIERVYKADADRKLQNQVNPLNYVVSGNQLWISTLNQGVMVVNMDNKKVNFYYSDPVNSNSIKENKILFISKDPEGNVWILNGAHNASVYVPFIHNFRVMYWINMDLKYTNSSAQNIPVNQLYVRDSDEIFISSGAGLMIYDYEDMAMRDFIDNDEMSYVHDVQRGVENFKLVEDTIFMCAELRPTFYDFKNRRKIQYFDQKGRFIVAFRHDESVNRYLGIFSSRMGDRIVEFFPETKTKKVVMQFPDDFKINEIFSFKTNQNNWIFSEANGRFVIVNPQDSSYLLFSPSRAESYFPDSTVTSVLINDNDMMYVGTKQGFYTFNELTHEYEDISSSVGLKEGEGVSSMVKDNLGRVWIALQTELVCWDPVSGGYYRYGKNLGVEVSNFLPAIGQKDEQGNLYFASMYGVLMFNPKDVIVPHKELLIELDEVKINSESLNNNEIRSLMEGEKQFHWDQNYMEFKFYTNQVFQLSPHQFDYMLEGLNIDWISNGANNVIRFDNLQYGKYKLLVKVKNAYNVESKILEIPFVVKKPFWFEWWFYVLAILAFSGVVYLLVKGRINALRKRSELLEKTVEERTAEVVEQKKEAERQKADAEHQKEIVEEKQKEITDSITYAKRIQDAIMPSDEQFKTSLPNSFVMYRPKDIVAGDFYWLVPLNENNVVFAAADCTGHGVPGAMVSVVCNNALNRSVREFKITDPGKILDSTRELVIDQFEQTATEIHNNHPQEESESSETIKDGMDISICKWDKMSNKLLWAGANNPIWLIRDNELQEIKGNKQPVGKFDPSEPFTTHELQLQEGDRFYLFSDGYADQFGGDKGKKFKSSSLKKLLMDIHQLPMNEQLIKLEKEFDLWKGDYEQLDDVCVIGVRI